MLTTGYTKQGDNEGERRGGLCGLGRLGGLHGLQWLRGYTGQQNYLFLLTNMRGCVIMVMLLVN
jgi:hypothetical protein